MNMSMYIKLSTEDAYNLLKKYHIESYSGFEESKIIMSVKKDNTRQQLEFKFDTRNQYHQFNNIVKKLYNKCNI